MMYKTIVLQLLQDRPHLHFQLRQDRQLLAAVDHCSTTLKTRHREVAAALSEKSPGRNPDQVAGEALEIALEELRAGLPAEPTEADQEPPSLDAAMAFVLGRSHRG